MTVDPEHEEAHTHPVGTITERLDEYLDVLEEEREVVEAMMADLEDAPDEESLTREEHRRIFPASMPTEEWGGFSG